MLELIQTAINSIVTDSSDTSGGNWITISNGSGYTSPYVWNYPYYTYPSVPVIQDFSVRKVEGGWIVSKDGKEHIITEAKEILQFLKIKE
jgi:hypothetical protein